MAKKSSKQPLKQPNVANEADTSLLVDTDSMPTTLPDVTLSPTQITFHDFIKLADIDTINTFLTATTFTSESENIKLLWERAYEEGYENGRNVALPVLHRVRTKLEEKFEHGVKRGMDLGREEGYNIAKGAFDKMVTKMKARDTSKVDTSDASTQIDSTTSTNTVSTQTYIHVAPLPFFTSISSQTDPNPTHLNVKNVSPVFMDTSQFSTTAADKINPIATATTISTQKMHPMLANSTQFHPLADTPVFSPKEPLSSHFNWADDARTLPILSTFTQRPSLPPHDLSGLRSQSTNPFLSLKRRRWHPQNLDHKYFQPRFNSSFCFPTPQWQPPCHLSQRPYAVSLDWDQDPHLADLSKALRTLGWVQR
jgi:hypothetical protein